MSTSSAALCLAHVLLGASATAAAAAVAAVPTVPIGGGVAMPMVALGTGSGQKGNVTEAVRLWLAVADGNAIDTAWEYFDEGAIAAGVAAAGVPRSRVFLETKIQCGTYEGATAQIAGNLKQLRVDSVDLTLLHSLEYCRGNATPAATWRALEDAKANGLTRAIGVSHFTQADFERLKTTARETPAVNQCELSVVYHDDETIAYCASRGIAYQAFSPLCGGFNGSSCSGNGGRNVMTVPEVVAVAKAHNVSAAQVGLKWIVQQGHALTTAVWNLGYMREDLDLWSWGNLTEPEMKTISAVAKPPALPRLR